MKTTFKLLELFLSREPTTDAVTLKYFPTAKKRDVVARRTPTGPIIARWPWHRKTKPRKGCRAVTLNCFVYLANWN
jgi:hypothetical protein